MQEQHTLFLDAETVSEQRKHMVLAPPAVEPLHEVFAEAMLEDTSAHQRRSPFDWIASIGVHFAVLAVLLVLPLYFTAGLDSHRLNLTFLAPPAMPGGPPPPPMTSSAVQHPPRVPVARMFNAGKLTAPSVIPKAVVVTPGEAAAPPDDAFAGVPGGVPGGQVGGVLGGILGGLPKGAPPAAPVAAPSGSKEPVRVGGLVKQPKLLFAPDADYPTLARQARLSGVVIVEAVIDEQGFVKGVRAVSGHPLLIPAALQAVSKRRYEPTILDGEPTPIDLRVEINFRFS